MPKLPSMSAAYVLKRKQITKALQEERAKNPPPVVKVRIAKTR